MQLKPIAHITSPYKQKFAIPRQPNLVREAVGEIIFEAEYSDLNALRGLDQFSHLWLIFAFHETASQGWSATVSPPRLGGTEKVGVFASRSMFRPNPIGMSVVEFVGIEQKGPTLILRVRGLDLLDGTPILDIKPYLPYADALPEARGGFAEDKPSSEIVVSFSSKAQKQLEHYKHKHPELKQFITAVLQQDPRPAQHARKNNERDYAMFLYDLNIHWRFEGLSCEVFDIE